MTHELVVEELGADHGRTPVLHGVALTVEPGALACVLGPSGCGKTTLLRAVAGFHRPSGGRITLRDRVLDEPPGPSVPAERRRIGYIPQDVALFPHRTVAANVGFGIGRAVRQQRVRELLELIGLADLADRYPHQLSGGQQQRVAIARALAPSPDLLLLDEPFSALDADLRARVRGEVVELLRATRTTAILVTHDAAEALAFADQITVMADGRVLQTGTSAALFDRPENAAVARALGAANVLPASVSGLQASTPLGVIELAGNGRRPMPTDAVLLRPRQLSVHGSAVPGSAPARVSRSTFQGDDYQLELVVPGCPDPIVAYASEPFSVGAVCQLRVDAPGHPLQRAAVTAP